MEWQGIYIMFNDTDLLFIEPRNQARPAPVIDDATLRMTAAFRAASSSTEYRGYHECRCGVRSTACDYLLPDGQKTNSLCVHYLAFHRPEVPETQLARVAALGYGKSHPNDKELQDPRVMLQVEPAIPSIEAWLPTPVQENAAAVRIYLDDQLQAPRGWLRARWPDEVIEWLEAGKVIELSLDHDLGDDERGTGYDVVLWIEEAVALRGFVPPTIHIHETNGSAREKMIRGLKTIHRFIESRGLAEMPKLDAK